MCMMSIEPAEIDLWGYWGLVTTVNQAPIFAHDALAAQMISLLQQTASHAVQHLWGYLVLPDALQFVVQTDSDHDYPLFVERLKRHSQPALVDAIRRHYEDLLDAITFYHPAWQTPIYQVWQAGYHTRALNTPYALSNKVVEMLQKPVELGLVETAAAWRFSSLHRD